MLPVAGSYAGVPVTPMFGVRSVHVLNVGSLAITKGLPSDTCHRTAPVPASSPYTWSVSVATMTVEPMTSGWANTAPSTTWPACDSPSAGSVHRWTNVETADGPMLGSFESQPSRSRFCDAVTSSASATAALNGATLPTAGSKPPTSTRPVEASGSRLVEP